MKQILRGDGTAMQFCELNVLDNGTSKGLPWSLSIDCPLLHMPVPTQPPL